eukprot:8208518-Lingulodinium_polyedra.AAC.1
MGRKEFQLWGCMRACSWCGIRMIIVCTCTSLNSWVDAPRAVPWRPAGRGRWKAALVFVLLWCPGFRDCPRYQSPSCKQSRLVVIVCNLGNPETRTTL